MAIFNLDYNSLGEHLQLEQKSRSRVLLMWYVMRSKDTPRTDKWAIFGSLAILSSR